MDLGPLRTLALNLNLSAHVVAATVTRPLPDNTPISTRGLWLRPADDSQPFGTDLRRHDPRRVLVLPRAAVPTLPRGTVVEAPEFGSDAIVSWRVDGIDQVAEADHWRALVVRV
jgi:hypothetical protein